MLVTCGCWLINVLDDRCWWQNLPKPSSTSQSCRQHIWSPTSVANIDVAVLDSETSSENGWLSWIPGLRRTHGFAHAKVKKSNFNRKILELISDIGIILNDFQSWFYSAIRIRVKLIWEENLKIPGIQPTDDDLKLIFIIVAIAMTITLIWLFCWVQWDYLFSYWSLKCCLSYVL